MGWLLHLGHIPENLSVLMLHIVIQQSHEGKLLEPVYGYYMTLKSIHLLILDEILLLAEVFFSQYIAWKVNIKKIELVYENFSKGCYVGLINFVPLIKLHLLLL